MSSLRASWRKTDGECVLAGTVSLAIKASETTTVSFFVK